jgi:uncharacterized membrane-anchored protein
MKEGKSKSTSRCLMFLTISCFSLHDYLLLGQLAVHFFFNKNGETWHMEITFVFVAIVCGFALDKLYCWEWREKYSKSLSLDKSSHGQSYWDEFWQEN